MYILITEAVCIDSRKFVRYGKYKVEVKMIPSAKITTCFPVSCVYTYTFRNLSIMNAKLVWYSLFLIIFVIFYFFNYILFLCYYGCLNYFLFSPLHPTPPHTLRQSPHCGLCPWVMHLCSMATLFPMLSFTSPWLCCNYQFVLLNSFTFFSHPPLSLFPSTTIKMFSVSMILF